MLGDCLYLQSYICHCYFSFTNTIRHDSKKRLTARGKYSARFRHHTFFRHHKICIRDHALEFLSITPSNISICNYGMNHRRRVMLIMCVHTGEECSNEYLIEWIYSYLQVRWDSRGGALPTARGMQDRELRPAAPWALHLEEGHLRTTPCAASGTLCAHLQIQQNNHKYMCSFINNESHTRIDKDTDIHHGKWLILGNFEPVVILIH